MSSAVLQVVPLGSPPWPTVDPFLFCTHHHDAYPVGNEQLGPATSLAGRQLGQDFAAVDGWNMYHGHVVPGFPQHPHRGFETVTYVRRGLVDHSDSLGATARFGRGDAQWLTAGGGIVHSEMFPLLDRDGPNPLELFQIWLNLPRADKLTEAHFAMLWDADIPRIAVARAAGGGGGGDGDGHVGITVIAGAVAGQVPPPPPPRSWAARADSDVAIWNIRAEPGGAWTMPPAAGADTVRTLYLYAGGSVVVGGHELASRHAAVVRTDVPVELVDAGSGCEILVLQGRPIGEPVAQYGPFVMNDEAGIRQAFTDYQATGFGGWPWPDDAPVHARHEGRFARHADGRMERPAAAAAPSA